MMARRTPHSYLAPLRPMSIRLRALLAVGLLVGFYVLALGIAGGLLWIPWAEWHYGDRVHAKIALFCAGGAFLILKAIVPRRDHFAPPGPRITAAEHPRLFAMIDDIARQTAQEPPAEVYLVNDVNAWVAQRGGTMGVGSKRVMGIGLPLMELLSEEELRAVLAHEFGHYVGGDTRLGPWIYKTRAAIGRTLEEVGAHSDFLAKPFEWYGNAFLRVTHGVSRAQEFVADAVAARVAGRDAMKRALVKIAGGAAAWQGFFRSELAPSLVRGYRPPLAAGFRQFMAAPSVAPQVARFLDEELASTKTDPYDTHPNLPDRLAAIERLPIDPAARRTPSPSDESPSCGLLRNLDVTEEKLLKWLTEGDVPKLVPVSWDDVPRRVLPVGWRETVSDARAGLFGLTPEQLPTLAADAPRLAARLKLTSTSPLHAHENRGDQAKAIVGCALSLVLLHRAEASGGRLHVEAPPGEPVCFRMDDLELLPFAVCDGLAAGTLSPDAWATLCERFGITGADLGVEVNAALAASPVTPVPAQKA
jgi:heat shock protein HtpX